MLHEVKLRKFRREPLDPRWTPVCTVHGDLTTTPVDAEDARVVKVRHELGQDGVRA